MSQQPALSQENLNRIVLEYLAKRGYVRTEAMLRLESGNQTAFASIAASDNKNRPAGLVNETANLYYEAYNSFKEWVESSLDLYKPELRRLLYPLFVHIFFDLCVKNQPTLAKNFFHDFMEDHKLLHGHDISVLSGVSTPEHLENNSLTKLFRRSKYRMQISRVTFDLLLHYIFERETKTGNIIIRLLNEHFDIKVLPGRPSRYVSEQDIDEFEGIENHANSQIHEYNSQPIKLQARAPNPELVEDVECAIDKIQNKEDPSIRLSDLKSDYDRKKAEIEKAGTTNLFDQLIPLPPYKTADIQAEIEALKESQAQFKLGPQAALPSVCMYTMHNTYSTLNCVKISPNNYLMAAGFADSCLRLWSVNKTLSQKALYDIHKDQLICTKLVGHSGAVYGLDFSPDNKMILSSSEDRSARLWSIDTKTALVAYKGHNDIVWDVKFGPFGHYFATASHDQTARLWSVEHIQPLRIFAGHLSDVDCLDFHPNAAYLVTGSNDKTCRFWDTARGNSVRVFPGHLQPISCVKVSPNGKLLASASYDGIIKLWDIGTGRIIKTMRGHEPSSAIYSLAFSQEGSILLSAGSDTQVLVWDVKGGSSEPKDSQASFIGSSSNDINGQKNSIEPTSDWIGKDGMRSSDPSQCFPTSDLLQTLYTKKTSIYHLKFTKRNLALAVGATSSVVS